MTYARWVRLLTVRLLARAGRQPSLPDRVQERASARFRKPAEGRLGTANSVSEARRSQSQRGRRHREHAAEPPSRWSTRSSATPSWATRSSRRRSTSRAFWRRNGFRIERNVAGMPTGWMATWGTGKPVIALGSDIDDIPQASQKPGVAYHDPIVAGAPGHGEGHNSGMPLQVTAALAVKKIMERERLPGTLKVWPGVAEELGGGKAYFVRAGAFSDVDVCLFAHVGNNFNVSWGDRVGTGVVSVEYTFKGESAHAAANPWRGRSALDAVELMDIGWNFRREHLRLQQRSHYVITERRRSAERRAVECQRLVLLPRDRLSAHQGAA